MATLCLFGAYDPDSPRLKRLLAAWEHLGGKIVTCAAPIWPGAGERAALPRSGKLRGFARRWLGAQVRLWRQHEAIAQADVVLVAYPGHLDMPMARALARRHGKPLVFDPFLSLWDTAVGDRGQYAAGSVTGRALKAIDQLALRLADRVLADTGPMADFYAQLAAIPRERLSVVPVGAEGSLFSPLIQESAPGAGLAPSLTPSKEREGLWGAPSENADPEACEVLFYGRMIPLQGVGVITQAALFLQHTPALSFHLIGHGQVFTAMDTPAFGRNVRHTDWVPYEKLPAAIAHATLCLGIFGTSDKARRVVPHKVYEAAAMGKPIITADTPAIREAFPDGSLALVPAGDADALADTILALCADPALRDRLGAAARRRYEEAFSTPAIAESLRAAMAEAGVTL
jgi:glycosyltransferase involved in cell wall biosynthesis